MATDQDTPPTRICKACAREFPLTLEFFYKDGKALGYRCKPCSLAAARQWALNNPDKARAKKEQWYLNNKTLTIARATKRQNEHPEEHRENTRKSAAMRSKEMYQDLKVWRKNNPEKAHAQVHKHYSKYADRYCAKRRERVQENPEKEREWNAKWNAAHPDERRAQKANRRALKLPTPGVHTHDDIDALYEAQGRMCANPLCLAPVTKTGEGRYEVDHIIPLKPRKGEPPGTNGPENLLLLCRPCNRGKHNMGLDEWARRRKLPADFIAALARRAAR